MSFIRIFPKNKCALIGMVHVLALPGTPFYEENDKDIIKKAISQAMAFQQNGFDGIIIENMFDVPYTKSVGPEIVAFLSVIATKIRKKIKMPVGIQVLAGANKEALAIAKAANLDFIRAEGYVFGHVADEGYMDAQAGDLLRYRKQIGADDIAIWTDIKKKHSSHSITNDISIGETAKAAQFFRSDGLIVTGVSTGVSTNPADLKTVRKFTDLPVIVGSGVTLNNLNTYLPIADAIIIGSWVKKMGNWKNDIDESRLKELMAGVKSFYAFHGGI